MRRGHVAWLILSALFVKSLWLLHPDMLMGIQNIPTHQMFPYAKNVWITKPTYLSYVCDKGMWLILIVAFAELMPEYRSVFGTLLIIQSLHFVQFFFNYNEPLLWIQINGHRLDIDTTLAKLTIPPGILIYQQIWKVRS